LKTELIVVGFLFTAALIDTCCFQKVFCIIPISYSESCVYLEFRLPESKATVHMSAICMAHGRSETLCLFCSSCSRCSHSHICFLFAKERERERETFLFTAFSILELKMWGLFAKDDWGNAEVSAVAGLGGRNHEM